MDRVESNLSELSLNEMSTIIYTALEPINVETDLYAHSGQEVTIVGTLSDGMRSIRFADGFEADAFDDELTVLS